MSSYKQLTQAQRYQIEALMKAGHNQSKIAEVLGVHKSTISRELRRNKGLRGYRPKQAQRLADSRHKEKARVCIATQTWNYVERLLQEDWSPEQISGWLWAEKTIPISHEWIYQYVYEDKCQGGSLYRHLRCQKTRRKRYGSYDRRGQIKSRISIDERPKIVERRSRIGDWEADTVIGKPGGAVLVTLAERKSRLSRIVLAADKTAQAVKNALLVALRPIAKQVYTLTYDNGKEFAYHEAIAEELDAKGFFAHPYHLSRVNYLVRFDDNYDGRLSGEDYVTFL